ncbi:epoxide hydrolase family protein [Desmospora activa]|uniref:Pimeloyl-ACP methyl ester carboxylesterase n=1 Tax=Desmospora activa DSM 45169 TaxID=1121389 RepID=A0A2T4ZA69_9BACL|nr:epoxide hydrolase family protein [Desmospora activa]PTM58791.1 pimeloyl-ACP methyl ester carboxylesterase [Desmospora activa DSM 45169]
MTSKNMHSPAIHPFRIEVSQKEYVDLLERLNHSRWPENSPKTGWERGVPLPYLKELTDYWQHHYDWRAHEEQLNKIPQFITNIEGQNIHFIHIKSPEPAATPLMLIHGWPGSFVEFLDVIGPLTDPRSHGSESSEAFHLIIPSIPGFGFSTPLNEPGWTPGKIAKVFVQLMDLLGYDKFGVQGGDSGAFIAPEMGHLAPERLIGIHLNALMTFPSGEEHEMDGLTAEEQMRLKRLETFNDGYLQIQSKSPQTLAYGLHDSPVGQLAWIIEIFKKWTNPEEALPEETIDRDRLLTNISIYWFSGISGSSAQIYYESMHDESAWIAKGRGTVPTGVLVSRSHDTTIRRFAERDHHIIHWTESSQAGHFFAMEQPGCFVEDVRRFFQSLKYGV